MKRALAVALLLLSIHPAAARPAPRSDDPNAAEAKRLFAEGTAAYNLAEYATAIDKYKAAYKLVANPYLIYNIAQAYRLAKDFENALTFYDSFLTQLPAAPNRAEVEGFMTDLRKQIAARDLAAATPPKSVVGEPQPSPSPDTKIPSPARVGDSVYGSRAPAPAAAVDRGGRRPLYKKWWFWAGVGAVAAGTVAIVVATSGGGGAADPDTYFPRKDLF